jgi:hypothetical protein
MDTMASSFVHPSVHLLDWFLSELDIRGRGLEGISYSGCTASGAMPIIISLTTPIITTFPDPIFKFSSSLFFFLYLAVSGQLVDDVCWRSSGR